MDLNKLKNDAKKVLQELILKSKLVSGDIVVVGCSTSEVVGEEIGTCSNVDVAQNLFEGFMDVINENEDSHVEDNINVVDDNTRDDDGDDGDGMMVTVYHLWNAYLSSN